MKRIIIIIAVSLMGIAMIDIGMTYISQTQQVPTREEQAYPGNGSEAVIDAADEVGEWIQEEIEQGK